MINSCFQIIRIPPPFMGLSLEEFYIILAKTNPEPFVKSEFLIARKPAVIAIAGFLFMSIGMELI